MRYKIGELQIFATPKAKLMFQFKSLPVLTFEFPGLVNTILFIHCGLVRESLRGGEDHYEIVGRLYSTYHPNQNEEKYDGKLYIRIYGYPNSTRFETFVEEFKWYPDGSFDVIKQDGTIYNINKPKNTIDKKEIKMSSNSSDEIMKQLEEFRNRYIDKDGNKLLLGGLDSYIYPDKIASIAKKYNYIKHKSYDINDTTLLKEVQNYLENDRMVAVVAWTRDNIIEIFLEH